MLCKVVKRRDESEFFQHKQSDKTSRGKKRHNDEFEEFAHNSNGQLNCKLWRKWNGINK